MGVVCRLLWLVLSTVTWYPPLCCFIFQWEASNDPGFPHSSLPAGLARGVQVSTWGLPHPSPLGLGFPTPPYPADHVQGVRVSAWGVPSPTFPDRRVLPPPSPIGCALRARVAARGVPPPSSVPWLRAGGGGYLVGVSSSIPWLREGSVRCCVGCPPPSSIPWIHNGGVF